MSYCCSKCNWWAITHNKRTDDCALLMCAFAGVYMYVCVCVCVCVCVWVSGCVVGGHVYIHTNVSQ